MISLIVAILFVFILPGIGYSFYFFYDSKLHEKAILGVAISMLITILLAFFLGGTASQKSLTGGYTYYNLILYLGIISVIGILLNFLRRKK